MICKNSLLTLIVCDLHNVFIMAMFYHNVLAMFQWNRLVADMGGLLGLFVGISMCTGVEFLELLVDLVIVAVKRRSKHNPTVHSENHTTPRQSNL